MNLDQELSKLLQDIAATTVHRPIANSDIIPLIDLTLLDEQASSQDIEALAVKAELHQVAAVCLLPQHLGDISSALSVKRATVVNFPGGDQPQEQMLDSLEQLLNMQQVDEIDYVFSYQAYLAGQQSLALAWCKQAYQRCKQHKILFKVIVEVGAFPSLALIYQASIDIINNGCDFLKTSTGKITTGASIPAAFALLSAIKNTDTPCGIKLSGGIRTTHQAISYLQLAQYMLNRKAENNWIRFGASGLLDDLLPPQ